MGKWAADADRASHLGVGKTEASGARHGDVAAIRGAKAQHIGRVGSTAADRPLRRRHAGLGGNGVDGIDHIAGARCHAIDGDVARRNLVAKGRHGGGPAHARRIGLGVVALGRQGIDGIGQGPGAVGVLSGSRAGLGGRNRMAAEQQVAAGQRGAGRGRHAGLRHLYVAVQHIGGFRQKQRRHRQRNRRATGIPAGLQLQAAIEQRVTVVTGTLLQVAGVAVTCRHFHLQGRPVGRIECAVGGLNRQGTDALEVVTDCGQGGIDHLGHGDHVVDIAQLGVAGTDLGLHPLRNHQAGGIVHSGVDAHTRGQALHATRSIQLSAVIGARSKSGGQIALRRNQGSFPA